MDHKSEILLVSLAGLMLMGCQSNPVALSDETRRETRSGFEEQKARQIHDEYWFAQMEREEARRAARERAEERARQQRESMSRD
jgi:hypothetical protein